MSKFSSYAVGYCGDHATVRLNLKQPVMSWSDKPKDEYNREMFPVITTSQTFNRAGISVAVREALQQKDYSTYVTLLNAQWALNQFIRENGSTNPYEAADWEVERPALKMA